MSFDAPQKNQAWAEDEGFAFELWTDADRTLALTYDAATRADQAFAERVTKVLDADGDLVLEYEKVKVGTHPGQVLADCEKLFGP